MEYEKFAAQTNADSAPSSGNNAAVGATSVFENGNISFSGEEKPEIADISDKFDNSHGQSQGGIEESEYKTVQKENDNRKHIQSSELNSEFARRRREEKRQSELKSARENAVIEALGGINPFTGEEMKDSADVDEFLTMKKFREDGKEPLRDFLSFRKEAIRRMEQEEEKSRFYRDDAENFFQQYPDADIEALAKDESFVSFAKGKIGSFPLAEIYSDYLSLTQMFNEKAKKIAAQSYANMRATPGSLTSSENIGNSFFTPEQVDAMNQEEVLRNYDLIRESMKKWHY